MNIKLIGVYGALHDGLAEAVSAGDEYHVAEARFGIQREHHASGTGLRTHHALNAGG